MQKLPNLCFALLGASLLLPPSFSRAQTAPPPSTTEPSASAPAVAPAAGAANDQPVTLNEFVTTGARASLASAQEIKQGNQQMVDSIVASDIDKLPDVNVSYALERITGVQVAHIFAGVGGNGGVTIDGLTQVENTLDGREVFTTGMTSGGGVGTGERTFNYSDIPSALVAGIDVYKSSAANQLDGGLGGLIDVRLHKPFDFATPQVAVTVGTTYSSLENEDKPNYNILLSDTFKTPIGKVGVLVDFTYQDQPWREDNIGIGNPTAAATASTSAPGALIASSYTTDTAEGLFRTVGTNAMVQWEVGPNLNVYAGFNMEQWYNIENQYELSIGLSAATVVPGSAQLYAGSSTNVESAAFSNVTASAFGIIRDLKDRSNQFYTGGDWKSGDLTLKADLSRYASEQGFYNNGVYSSAAIPGFNYNFGSTIPSGVVSGASLLDPSIYKLTQVYNRLDPSTGYETAGKLDGEYKLPGFFTSVLAGFRYASTESDNGSTGLFLGSYNLPAGSQALSNSGGQWVPSPVENFFSGYHEPTVFQYLAQSTGNLRNTAALLQSYGDTTTNPHTDATVNPLSLYHILEQTTAFYIEPKFAGNLFGLNFDGNIGLRFVATEDDLKGFQTVTPAAVSPTGLAILGPLALKDTYRDWLPSLNYRLKLTDTFFLRLTASKTITRPNFSQLSPSLTLNQNPITPSLNTGSQGNPDLQPMRSDNVNVSLEKYFNPSTSVFASALYKKVTGFPASITAPETYGGQVYQVTTYANLNPATIKGFEVGYQEFFSFLPQPFDGLGVQGNFTYIASTTPSSIQGYTIPLTNLSRDSYNAIVMYEKGHFSARLAYNWRSKFVTGVSSFVGVGLLPQFIKNYGDLDGSINYDITKNLGITIQAVNLTNSMRSQYWGTPATPSNYYLDGTQLMASMTIRL